MQQPTTFQLGLECEWEWEPYVIRKLLNFLRILIVRNVSFEVFDVMLINFVTVNPKEYKINGYFIK